MSNINLKIENHVHTLIEDLRSRLLFMAAKTQQAVDNTCTALDNLDFELAEKVIDGDEEINELEVEIDNTALSILARTQPVASDLRLLVSSIRLVVELERIADEASIISNRLILLQEQRHVPIPTELMLLARKAQYILEEGIKSFREGNTQITITLRTQQDEITQLVVKNIEVFIKGLQANKLDPWLAMHYILITRAFERIIGRAVNVSEHTYFLVEGVNIKHRPL